MKKNISIVSLFVLLTIGGYYLIKILPAQIAYKTINNFESSYYNGKPEDSLKYLYEGTFITKWFKANPQLIVDSFLKFKPGVKVTRCTWLFSNVPGETNNSIIIEVFFSKVALIDKRERDFFEATLIRNQGQWKFILFAFPDYIDY